VGSGKKTAEQYPVANADEARSAVRDLKRKGADFIKIISVPSKEVFFAVADEAKKQGIPFVGHLPFQVGAIEASDAESVALSTSFTARSRCRFLQRRTICAPDWWPQRKRAIP